MLIHERELRADHTVDTQLFIITGYSGAGKNSVLKALEDCGFFCIDNLPMPLLSPFFDLMMKNIVKEQRVALGVDVRSGTTTQQLRKELDTLGQLKNCIKIFFVTSSYPVLVKRFQETRRKHPLADKCDTADAIKQEQELMKPFMQMADVVIDTDQLNIHQLRNFIRNVVAMQHEHRLMVSLVSFGFKYGVPSESNFIFDVSALPNPYFVPTLKSLSGKDLEIQDFLFNQQTVQDYWHVLISFITYAVKKSYQEGRLCITIAIGCTGGRHRSVAFVERLSQTPFENSQFFVRHRDIHNEHGI